MNYNTYKNMDESYKYKFEQMNSNTKEYLLYNFLYIKFKKRQNEPMVEMGTGSILLGRGDVVTRNEAQRSEGMMGMRESVPRSGCWLHRYGNFMNT